MKERNQRVSKFVSNFIWFFFNFSFMHRSRKRRVLYIYFTWRRKHFILGYTPHGATSTHDLSLKSYKKFQSPSIFLFLNKKPQYFVSIVLISMINFVDFYVLYVTVQPLFWYIWDFPRNMCNFHLIQYKIFIYFNKKIE